MDVSVDLPTLTELRELDMYIRDEIPLQGDQGLGSVGLILCPELEAGGYDCSPVNALTFARTGGDGDHYGLIECGGEITESSPVVLTWTGEGTHTIVGESLYDFLCFGLHGGYFSILPGHGDEPTVQTEGLSFYSHVTEQQAEILNLLCDELGLEPWPQPDRLARFKAMQEEYLPLVIVPDEEDW